MKTRRVCAYCAILLSWTFAGPAIAQSADDAQPMATQGSNMPQAVDATASGSGSSTTGVLQMSDAQPSDTPQASDPTDPSTAPSTGAAKISDAPPGVTYGPANTYGYDPGPYGTGPGVFTLPNSTSTGIGAFAAANPININPYIRFRTDFGSGVGYQRGYNTVSSFLPFMIEPGQSLIFLDTRGFVTNFGDFGGNVGLGIRRLFPDIGRIYGASFWYDHDHNTVQQYNRFGFSLESLSQYADFRVNGYFPTNRSQVVASTQLTGTAFFINNNIGLGQTRQIATALTGADWEVGSSMIPGLGDYGIRPYAGMYVYNGNGVGTTVGFQTRTEFLITQNLTMQVAAYNDKFFGTTVNGAVQYLIPNGRPKRFLQRQPLQQRLFSADVRNYRIAVDTRTDNTPTLALRDGNGPGELNGPVGTPIVVVHVDNTAAPGGNGSFLHPFNSLSEASSLPNVDIVYVHRGDGTSTNMDTGIVLADNQRLLGEGVQHLFTALQAPGVQFVLPDNTLNNGTTLFSPIITNTGGDAVTLANNNEVSGFIIGNVANAGLAALAGNGISGSGISDFNLNNLLIQNAGLSGIELVNVASSDPSNPSTISNVILQDNTMRGLDINNSSTAELDVVLTGSPATSTTGVSPGGEGVTATGNGLAGIGLTADNSTINVVSSGTAAAAGVTSNANDTGMLINATDNATITYTSANPLGGPGDSFSNNKSSVNPNTGNGMTINADNSFVQLSLTGATLNMNNGNAIQGSFTNNAVGNFSFIDTALTNSIFGGGLIMHVVDDSTLILNASSGSSFSGNNTNGIGITLTDTSALNATIDSSILSNQAFIQPKAPALPDNTNGNGFYLAGDNSIANVTVTNSSIDSNTGNGLAFFQTGASNFTINISNNISTNSTATDPVGISTNALAGILLNNNASTSTVTIGNNLISGNGTLVASDTSAAGFGAGISFVNNTGNINANVIQNTITNNAEQGFLAVTTGGVTNLEIGGPNSNDGNTFDNNHGAAVEDQMLGAGGSSIVDISNNSISDTGALLPASTLATGQGILLDLHGTNSVTGTFNNNQIFSNLTAGMQFNQTDTSNLNATIQGNMIGLSLPPSGSSIPTPAGNSGDGIQFNRMINATTTVLIGGTLTGQANFIENNLGNGIHINAQGTATNTLSFTITDNTIFANHLDGILISAVGTAQVDTEISGNTISHNLLNGIETTSNGTSNNVTGTWDSNTITFNGTAAAGANPAVGDGILIESNVFNQTNFSLPGLTISNNIISNNFLNGFEIEETGTGAAVLSFLNNTVANNGNDGILVGLADQSFANLTINNNTISSNGGTGVDLEPNIGANGTLPDLNGSDVVTGTGLDLIVSMDSDLINDNAQRGILLNNSGESDTSLTITNTTVQGNGAEGIFIFTNAAAFTNNIFTTQTQSGGGGGDTGFGGVGVDNNVVLVMNADQVLGNGGSSTIGSGGLVIDVGTSQLGGVFADIENSTFLGNTAASNAASGTGTGSDVLFASYLSAPILPNPPNGADPLARLDLQFRGNTVGVLDASHFSGNTFYNNSDPIKSPSPVPFTTNARPRNAQREAVGAITGIGSSTFRVEADALLPATNTITVGTISDFNTQVPMNGGDPADTAAFPFDWQAVPVGTLFP